ncbi:hypothetical protein [uncultured Phenylobacterium sp.]|uniref:terminase small subunit-like protein n=1 Tax=uncultured Phenylobacterium sp. TaxID=349273 RepID=UPI0025D56D6A|nr:hypothetical protein [uncultured Phenylobacterium sp.]
MAPPTLRSEALVRSIVERMERGASLRQVSLEPGMPAWFTLMRWQRRDPALKARFAQARAWGRGVRFEGRHQDRFRFDPVRALELVERVRAGEPLRKLARRDGVVERQALNGWKRASPDFGLRLEAAKLAGRAVRARRQAMRPLPWPWDEALSDRIVLRVMRGERLIDVARGPDFPGLHVLRRWRREHPEFDGALKSAIRRGRRVAVSGRGRYTPQMAEQVCARIAAGAALSDIRDDPALPHDNTIRAWTRTRPDFAARLADARDFRAWLVGDEIVDIAATATPATVKEAARRIGRLRTRLRATAPKRPV